MLGILILAGGRSKRIRENKALVKLEGKPLLSYVVEKVLGLARELIVVIGKGDEISEHATILPPRVTVVKDFTNEKGPLVGILTGMRKMRSEYAVVLPCDSPFIEKEVLRYLRDRARGADAVIPRWPNGNIEPLHAVYRISSTIPAAEDSIRKEELRILDMINRLGKVIYVNTDEIRKFDRELMTFFNINSKEDLRAASEMLKSREK